MNEIAFEMWIIFCHWDLHGRFIRSIKIGHKLAVVLGVQDDKKNSTSNNGQTIEFCQNPLLQEIFFMSKSAWEYYQILYSIYIVYSLTIYIVCLHHTKFVLYHLLHLNKKFFSRIFPGITLEESHICAEPTK